MQQSLSQQQDPQQLQPEELLLPEQEKDGQNLDGNQNSLHCHQ
jgi:hypothetical protein